MKKRAVERLDANLEAEFSLSDQVITGSIVNLSEKGFLLNTKKCPPMRAKFDLTIWMDNEVLKMPVKVRRLVKKDHYYEAAGVEILNPPKQYLDLVNDLRWKQLKSLKTRGQIIKLFICTVCHHISFDHAPITCPICSSTIESFEKAPDAIKRPDNFAELSELEKKHIPVIRLTKDSDYVNVHVVVGEILHEMDIDNHICFIDCYYSSSHIQKKCVSRINFNCDRIHPSTTLRFNYVTGGVITVIIKCNAHGNWLAKANL